MSNYKIETIRLGIQESNTDYWVDDVNDAKIATIAEALGLKVNTITSNSEWILYKGDDVYNTTGFKFYHTTNRLTISDVVAGKDPSGNLNVSIPASLTRSYSGSAYTAKLSYVKTKDGVVFGVENREDGGNISCLRMMAMSGHNLKTNDESVVYMACQTSSTVICYLNSSTNATGEAPSQQSDPEDLVVLFPFVKDYVKIDGTYAMAHGRYSSQTPYSFRLNDDKKYLMPWSYSYENRLALELPDEET